MLLTSCPLRSLFRSQEVVIAEQPIIETRGGAKLGQKCLDSQKSTSSVGTSLVTELLEIHTLIKKIQLMLRHGCEFSREGGNLQSLPRWRRMLVTESITTILTGIQPSVPCTGTQDYTITWTSDRQLILHELFTLFSMFPHSFKQYHLYGVWSIAWKHKYQQNIFF